MWWRDLNDRGSGFVNIMGWLTLALGVMGVGSGSLQGVLFIWIVPMPDLIQLVDEFYEAGILPIAYVWLVERLPYLWPYTVLGSLFTCAASFGLLLRTIWGLWSFVLLIVGTIAANAYVCWWLASNIEHLIPAQLPPDAVETQVVVLQTLVWAVALLTLTFFWPLLRLLRSPVRDEFRRG